MKKWIFPVSLIVLGSFLEIYYYAYRFARDGITPWLAITIGCALTLLLALAVVQRNNLWAWLIIVPLAAYSIMATSAGQSFSLGAVLEEQAEKSAIQLNAQDAIEEYRANIRRLDREEAQLLESTEGLTLRDRANFRTYGIAPIEERKAAIADERRMWQKKIDDERARLTTHVRVGEKTTNIYDFYHDLFGLDASWLQFILQTILSAFIAVMAPVGIMTLPKTTKKRKPKNNRQEKKSIDWSPYVAQWVRINWVGKRNGNSNNILEDETYRTYCQKQRINSPPKIAKAITQAAERAGVIDNRKIVVGNEEQAKARIMQYLT
ncbi:MAG: hypothetical protein PVJ39_04595 [Gammaproteobacteria bacterium]|jgi:hypothetical protein